MTMISDKKSKGQLRFKSGKSAVASNIGVYVVLGLWALLCLFPVYWMFTFSLKDNAEIFGANVIGLPQVYQWNNYVRAWNLVDMVNYFRNSFLIAVIAIALTLIAACMATYALTRLAWKGRKRMNKFFMLGLTIPIHAAIYPLYLILSKIHWLDSLQALFIPYAAFSLSMGILICTGFMGDIPYDLYRGRTGCRCWRGIGGRSLPRWPF